MKDMNELEAQLASWALRNPSAKLEKRIFGLSRRSKAASQPAETERPAPHFSFGWLVPATASLLLLALLVNPRTTQNLSESASSGPMVAMIMSNQSAAAWLPGSFKNEQNSIPADTFEWTNAGGYTSSIRSLSGPRGSN